MDASTLIHKLLKIFAANLSKQSLSSTSNIPRLLILWISASRTGPLRARDLMLWFCQHLQPEDFIRVTYNSSWMSSGRQKRFPRCESLQVSTLPRSRHNVSILRPSSVNRLTSCLIAFKELVTMPELDIIRAIVSLSFDLIYRRQSLFFNREKRIFTKRARTVSILIWQSSRPKYW